MSSVEVLMDNAIALCKTEAELARRTGGLLTQQQINDMRKGRKTISPETVAILCDVLQLPGEEARQWLALAVVENPKNAGKAEVLKRALFACWLAGVVSLCAFQSDARATGSTNSHAIYKANRIIDTLYIVVNWTHRKLRRLVRRWMSARTRQEACRAGSAFQGARALCW